MIRMHLLFIFANFNNDCIHVDGCTKVFLKTDWIFSHIFCNNLKKTNYRFPSFTEKLGINSFYERHFSQFSRYFLKLFKGIAIDICLISFSKVYFIKFCICAATHYSAIKLLFPLKILFIYLFIYFHCRILYCILSTFLKMILGCVKNLSRYKQKIYEEMPSFLKEHLDKNK